MTNWQPIGDAAQRVVESCSADVRDTQIRLQRELTLLPTSASKRGKK
jgi:hypothetical protein